MGGPPTLSTQTIRKLVCLDRNIFLWGIHPPILRHAESVGQLVLRTVRPYWSPTVNLTWAPRKIEVETTTIGADAWTVVRRFLTKVYSAAILACERLVHVLRAIPESPHWYKWDMGPYIICIYCIYIYVYLYIYTHFPNFQLLNCFTQLWWLVTRALVLWTALLSAYAGPCHKIPSARVGRHHNLTACYGKWPQNADDLPMNNGAFPLRKLFEEMVFLLKTHDYH